MAPKKPKCLKKPAAAPPAKPVAGPPLKRAKQHICELVAAPPPIHVDATPHLATEISLHDRVYLDEVDDQTFVLTDTLTQEQHTLPTGDWVLVVSDNGSEAVVVQATSADAPGTRCAARASASSACASRSSRSFV